MGHTHLAIRFARSLLSAFSALYCHDYIFGSGPWGGELELYSHGYSNFGSGPGGRG